MIRNITTDTHHLFLTDEFSQWYPSEFTDEKGRLFHCCEQWMMVNKAELFGDVETARKIMLAKTPAECKELGRAVSPFDPKLWDERAPEIVLRGNLMKFSQNPDLWAALDATGERLLVEAASYDKIWGIGLGAEAALAMGPELWPLHGRNELGKATTATRSTLRAHPELLSAPGPWQDQRTLAFYDAPGQRTLRFTPREVAASLGRSPEELEGALRSRGSSPVQMDKPGFLRKDQRLSLPAHVLLAQLSPAPARKPAP